MNTLKLLLDRDLSPKTLAFFPLDGTPVDFQEMYSKAVAARIRLQKVGVVPGSAVLMADQISAEFYSVVMAVLSLGATVMLVEPFLPLSEIELIVDRIKPKVLVTSWMGRVWGIRAKSIRTIPYWISSQKLCGSGSGGKLIAESVSPEFPGIITFTTGTTGKAKGVVRTHSGLTAQNLAIRNAAQMDQYQKPDLAIFANLVLANLGMGRGTIFVPPRWKKNDLKKIEALPSELQPETLSCGPAFLNQLMKLQRLPKLKSIHVGGALTDCSIFEESFKRFGENTRFIHVYGSSEAEPVAFVDARIAVNESRNRGFVQTLLVGKMIPEIKASQESSGLWVTGPHVCPYYVANDLENSKTKRRDDEGRIWHFMGDRIEQDSEGFWYQGRSFQTKEDFLLEQRVYAFLQNTACFVQRTPDHKLILKGEEVESRGSELLKKFPEIQQVQEVKIKRDRRHRARIDRGASS